MKNKVFLRIVPAVLLALALTACTGEKDADAPEDTTEKVADWRDEIKYDGSLSTSDTRTLLYSIDDETITLWDDNGGGEVLQTLKYATSEESTPVQLEVLDLNKDGFADLRLTQMIEEEPVYNLFVWNEKEGSYVSCNHLYQITRYGNKGKNPTSYAVSQSSYGGLKILGCQLNKGEFGILETWYEWTDIDTLEQLGNGVSNSVEIARSMALSLMGSDVVCVMPDKIVVLDEKCETFLVKDETGAELGYLACSPGADWYIDIGCQNTYQQVLWENDAYQTGAFVDSLNSVQK